MGRRAEWRLIATRFPLRFGRARFLACRRAALSGLPLTQLRGRAPAFVGGWRQARRHGGRSVFRNCSVTFGLAVSVGRRCSCRLHSFPQLDKKFSTNSRKGLDKRFRLCYTVATPEPQGYPPNVRPRAPANAVAASLFVGTAKTRQVATWRAFSLPAAALSLSRKRRARRHKAPCDGLRAGVLPAVSVPLGGASGGAGGWTTGAGQPSAERVDPT